MRRTGRRTYLERSDCLTPFGDAKGTHTALANGLSALRATPALGRQGGDAVPLALLPGRELDETMPPAWLEALGAFLAPVRESGWGAARRPICFSSSNFGVGSLLAYRFTNEPGHLAFGTPDGCVARICERMGWGGNRVIFSHACVSAHLALAHADRLLAAGLAEAVLVVSFDFLSPFVVGGFHSLKILNAQFPAPFQARETGAIGLGDGAGYAVLTTGAIDWELAAQTTHNEMFHFTGNAPEGAGFAATLEPLASSGRRLWLKGHGTGTLEPGKNEALAFARLFPDAPLVGWKGALGHTLGSCGLVELAIARVALETGMTPGTVGAAAPTFAPNVALAAFDNRAFDGVLCASNAFGGAHAALILSHA